MPFACPIAAFIFLPRELVVMVVVVPSSLATAAPFYPPPPSLHSPGSWDYGDHLWSTLPLSYSLTAAPIYPSSFLVSVSPSFCSGKPLIPPPPTPSPCSMSKAWGIPKADRQIDTVDRYMHTYRLVATDVPSSSFCHHPHTCGGGVSSTFSFLSPPIHVGGGQLHVHARRVIHAPTLWPLIPSLPLPAPSLAPAQCLRMSSIPKVIIDTDFRTPPPPQRLD